MAGFRVATRNNSLTPRLPEFGDDAFRMIADLTLERSLVVIRLEWCDTNQPHGRGARWTRRL